VFAKIFLWEKLEHFIFISVVQLLLRWIFWHTSSLALIGKVETHLPKMRQSSQQPSIIVKKLTNDICKMVTFVLQLICNNFAECSEMVDCWISGPSTVVALLRHLNAVLVQRRPAREPSILAYLIKVNYKCHQTMTVATWQMTMESTPSTPRPYQFESVIYNTRTSAEIMFHCWLGSG